MMTFRLLKHTFVLERRCSLLLRSFSTYKHTSKIFHRTNSISPNNFIGNTNFTRCCVTARSETASTSSQNAQEEIYNSLKTEVLAKNRVLLPAIQEYLRLRQGSDVLRQDEAILLLDVVRHSLPYVPPEKKQELIKQIWTGVPAELKRNEDLVVCYLKTCRSNATPLNYDNFIVQTGIKVSPVIMKEIMDCVAETGNTTEIKKLLDEMKERGFAINETAYAALIRNYGIAKNLKEVNAVVDIMASMKIEMTAVTQCQVIQAYLRNDKGEHAKVLLKEYGKAMNEMQLLQILRTTLKFYPVKDLITLVLSFFPSDVLTDKKIYTPFKNICSELNLERKYDEIFTFISCLPVPTFTEVDDLDAYGTFMLNEMVLKVAPLDKILQYVKLLKDEKRNEMALRNVTGLALQYFSPMANDLLETLSKEEALRNHYFWPLFMYNTMVEGEMGILKTLNLMKKYNVEVDVDTLKFYVLPKLNLTLSNVEKGVKELEEVGVKPSFLLTNLTTHLLFQRRFEDAIHINSLYTSKLDPKSFVHPLVTAFSFAKSNEDLIPVIANLVKRLNDKRKEQNYDFPGHLFTVLITKSHSKHENRKLIQFIGELSLHGIKISKIAAEILHQHLSRDLDEEQLKTYFENFVDNNVTLPADEMLYIPIKHPRDMNLEDLECHYRELEAKGMNTRGVLRLLLQQNVRLKRYERALEVKALCDKQKVDMSPGMLAAIFNIYVKTGRDKEAQDLLKRIQKQFPGFSIDSFKIVDFAALLAEKGNFQEAEKVLKMQPHLEKIGNFTKNIWQLLNNVAQVAPTLKYYDPSENQSKRFLKLLMDLKYCTYQNSIVGPIIKEYLNNNDLKSAVEEYVYFCTNHRLTPLTQQILIVLLDAFNREEVAKQYSVTTSEIQNMLQEVIKASSAIHGPTNTNLQLIVATAIVGTEKQLRKLLVDPNLRFNPSTLFKQCEYLNSIGKIDALIKLAKCSRGLGHGQEQNIYNMILESLIKENNYKAALNLFDELMSDDEMKISGEFKKNLVDLLKRNNLELPANIAVHVK